MGREFASAAARWLHLPDMQIRPRIVAICDRSVGAEDGLARWYKALHPGILQVTADYRQLLSNPEVEAACVTPEGTALSHRLFTAALESQREKTTIPLRG